MTKIKNLKTYFVTKSTPSDRESQNTYKKSKRYLKFN